MPCPRLLRPRCRILRCRPGWSSKETSACLARSVSPSRSTRRPPSTQKSSARQISNWTEPLVHAWVEHGAFCARGFGSARWIFALRRRYMGAHQSGLEKRTRRTHTEKRVGAAHGWGGKNPAPQGQREVAGARAYRPTGGRGLIRGGGGLGGRGWGGRGRAGGRTAGRRGATGAREARGARGVQGLPVAPSARRWPCPGCLLRCSCASLSPGRGQVRAHLAEHVLQVDFSVPEGEHIDAV